MTPSFPLNPANEDIKSPGCPMCDVAPRMATSIAQAFCESEGCPVFCWDMRVTPEEFRRTAVSVTIDLGASPASD